MLRIDAKLSKILLHSFEETFTSFFRTNGFRKREFLIFFVTFQLFVFPINAPATVLPSANILCPVQFSLYIFPTKLQLHFVEIQRQFRTPWSLINFSLRAKCLVRASNFRVDYYRSN